MLPSRNRTTYQLFKLNQNIYKQILSPSFLVLIKKSAEDNPRFVFLIPKKLDKRSTRRHLTKRILTEIIRQNLPLFPKSYDYLFRIKKIIGREERKELEKEVSILIYEFRSCHCEDFDGHRRTRQSF